MRVIKNLIATLPIMAVSMAATESFAGGARADAASGVAPLEVALTLAQTPSKKAAGVDTLLVLREKTDSIEAVNLSAIFGRKPKDPLDLVASVGREDILKAAASVPVSNYLRVNLKASPILGTKHIAAGTNYVAHQEEAGIHRGFLFPKISEPSSFISQVKAPPRALMDYEVELCFRFQDDVDSIEDFESSIKGFFICGDMSDRAELLRKVDVDDLASGIGFTDAKSGDDRFPVGPYTVVPVDWRQFVEAVDIHTTVNGELRQQSPASKMIKKADELVVDILDNGQKSHWLYKGEQLPLIENNYIGKDTAILTGTPEGVIYDGISLWSKIVWGTQWAVSFDFLDGSVVSYVIEKTIQEGFSSKNYLQPGDQVILGGTYLGSINLSIVE